MHEHVAAGKIEPKKVQPARSGPEVPGLAVNETLSKSQIKSRKKKEAAQRKKEAEELMATVKAQEKPSGQSEGIRVADIDSLDVAEKRERTLNKKLKQIQSLRESEKAGQVLNEEQLLKVRFVEELLSLFVPY